MLRYLITGIKLLQRCSWPWWMRAFAQAGRLKARLLTLALIIRSSRVALLRPAFFFQPRRTKEILNLRISWPYRCRRAIKGTQASTRGFDVSFSKKVRLRARVVASWIYVKRGSLYPPEYTGLSRRDNRAVNEAARSLKTLVLRAMHNEKKVCEVPYAGDIDLLCTSVGIFN